MTEGDGVLLFCIHEKMNFLFIFYSLVLDLA
jgi:hypothetical protein